MTMTKNRADPRVIALIAWFRYAEFANGAPMARTIDAERLE